MKTTTALMTRLKVSNKLAILEYLLIQFLAKTQQVKPPKSEFKLELPRASCLALT